MLGELFCEQVSSFVDRQSFLFVLGRLRVLINQARLMVFMKGSAQVPRCGFSRQLIEILNSTGSVLLHTFILGLVNGIILATLQRVVPILYWSLFINISKLYFHAGRLLDRALLERN